MSFSWVYANVMFMMVNVTSFCAPWSKAEVLSFLTTITLLSVHTWLSGARLKIVGFNEEPDPKPSTLSSMCWQWGNFEYTNHTLTTFSPPAPEVEAGESVSKFWVKPKSLHNKPSQPSLRSVQVPTLVNWTGWVSNNFKLHYGQPDFLSLNLFQTPSQYLPSRLTSAWLIQFWADCEQILSKDPVPPPWAHWAWQWRCLR